MADINVQRKSGTPWWAWLLGLLLLALLAWLLWGLLDNDEEPEVVEPVPAAVPVVPVVPVDTAVGVTGAVPPVVETYLATCAAPAADAPDMGREHQFTIGCFRDLRAAIDTVMRAGQVTGVDVDQRLSAFQTAVQNLEQSQPTSTEHAGMIRNAAQAASALMQGMLTTGYGGQPEVTTAVGDVEQAINGIQASTPVLEQRDSVRNFFREAGEALRLMAQRAPATGAPA